MLGRLCLIFARRTLVSDSSPTSNPNKGLILKHSMGLSFRRVEAFLFPMQVQNGKYGAFQLTQEEIKNSKQPYTPAKRQFWLQLYHKEKFKSIAEFTRRYPIKRRTMSDWLRDEEKWKAAGDHFSLDKARLRESKRPELDKMLWTWFQDVKEREANFPLSKSILVGKAREFSVLIKNPALLQSYKETKQEPPQEEVLEGSPALFTREDFLDHDYEDQLEISQAQEQGPTTSTTERKPPVSERRYRGLMNANLNCYANAVIQSFYMNQYIKKVIETAPPFDETEQPVERFQGEELLTEEEKQYKKKLTEKMRLDLHLLFSVLDDSFDLSLAADPQDILDDYRDDQKQPLNQNIQHDAGEFMSQLITNLDGPGSPIRRALSTKYCEQIVCPQNHIHNRIAYFLDWKCSLNDIVSLQEALKDMVAGEKIDEYFCPECQYHYYQRAMKRTMIEALPSVWIVSPNRFKYKNDTLSKDYSEFSFPLDQSISLRPFLHSTIAEKEKCIPNLFTHLETVRFTTTYMKRIERAPHLFIPDDGDNVNDSQAEAQQNQESEVFVFGRSLRSVKGREASYYAKMNAGSQYPAASSSINSSSSTSAKETPLYEELPSPEKPEATMCTEEEEAEFSYHISGIIAHKGTPQSGHYISFIRQSDTPYDWLQFDDRSVKRVPGNTLPPSLFGRKKQTKWNPSMAQQFSAYILFFSRGLSPDYASEPKEVSEQIQDDDHTASSEAPSSSSQPAAIVTLPSDSETRVDKSPADTQANHEDQAPTEERDGGKQKVKHDDDELSSWVQRWMDRHNIHGVRLHGDSGGADQRIKDTWLDTVFRDICTKYNPPDIWNADETGLFYDQLPGFTYVSDDSTPHGSKQSKARITIVLAASMTGQKRRLTMIGRTQSLERVNHDWPRAYDYYSQANAWMDQELFDKFCNIWNEELKAMKRHIALIVDNCLVHNPLKEFSNIAIFFLPPGQTSIVQPVDQGMVRSIKAKYRAALLRRKLDELQKNPERKTLVGLTKEEKVKQLCLRKVQYASLICHAWKEVTSETIHNCFEAAGWWKIAEEIVQEQTDLELVCVYPSSSSETTTEPSGIQPTPEEVEALASAQESLKELGQTITSASSFKVQNENILTKEPFSARLRERVLAVIGITVPEDDEDEISEGDSEKITSVKEEEQFSDEYLAKVQEASQLVQEFASVRIKRKKPAEYSIVTGVLNDVHQDAETIKERKRREQIKQTAMIQTQLTLRPVGVQKAESKRSSQ